MRVGQVPSSDLVAQHPVGGPVDLEAVRRRLDSATGGPWERHGCDVYAGGDRLLRGRDGSSAERQQADRDAEFVAHARDDITELLRALEDASRREPAPS